MAAVNSVQGGLRLPLAGLAPPRVLMCSASMGAEGSVTLQLREAVQAPESGAPLDAALTIGYPNSEILADMLGTLQAAASNSNNITNNSTSTSNNSNNNNNNCNSSSGTNNNHNNNTNININNNNNISNNDTPSSLTANLTAVKKPRPKTASPTRHGPQQCQVCSKIFGNASALAKHKLTHSDERKYVCVMCSKAFKRQDHLNGHMLTHRNKKPYECKAEGCGKSYCDARSLRRHTENHHSSLAMTPTTPNQSMSSSTGPPTGLSLSPATASGDASSPHGATCNQYSTNSDGSSSKPSSPSSPAGAGNEGLTRQQLDLISQIMQQTKQANANLATAGQRQTQRPRTWNMQTQLQQNQSKLSSNPDSPNGSSPGTSQNIPKVEQKPVECNLCHRKFKNIPALNGHMRLHGGYIKKDSETRKCDKKETPGPPLQTASVGVRALIEEKIISKRSKDLKGAFVVPAPPLSARRLSDTDGFLSPKLPVSVATSVQTTNVSSGPSATITNICQATTTIATTLQIASGTALSTTSSATIGHKTTIGPSSGADGKDATLIELLKRGTKVAVKRTCSDPGQLTFNTSSISSSQNSATAVVLPTSTQSLSTPSTPTATPPLALSLSGGDSTPLALTISQAPSGSGDVFTLAYSADTSATFFGENEVYSVNDTAMLLQAVDSIQLLHDSAATDQLDEIASLTDYTMTDSGSISDSVTLTSNFTPSHQLQAVLNSPLPESLAEFSTLHSKDYVLYGCASSNSPAATQSSTSPLPSPLAYPTPPASHEAVAQASPFLDDSHHFSDASSFFNEEKKNASSFLDEHNGQLCFKGTTDKHLSENERILQLKNELFNGSKSVLDEKVGNFFKDEDESESNRLRDFTHQNLSFLDEPQSFLDDARNTSSPLSAAFFTATMSSAEEVKEALQEVLPNENIAEDNTTENDIDLYYLPSLSLQSQMMPNSDDPLLSSSPKDFASKPHQFHKFDFGVFCPPSAKKSKANDDRSVEHTEPVNNKAAPLTVQTEQMPPKDSEVFLSPSSISSTSTSTPSPKTNITMRKRHHTEIIPRVFEIFKSRLRTNKSSTHFSPSPILNPSRNTTGIYFCLIKDGLQEDDCDLSCEEAVSTDVLNKPKVNIGTNYQATIPNLRDDCDSITSDFLNRETLLWDPTVNNDEKQLQRYIDLSKSSAVPLGSHSEEMALRALMESQGEIQTAILELLQAPPIALHKRWAASEIKLFLRGLETWRKDFYRISKEIPNKNTGDCIQLYYFWKKLCVDYKTTHLQQNWQRRIPMELNNNSFTLNNDSSIGSHHHYNSHSQSHPEIRAHICEMPDCSASFSSKAALHGHTKLHCIGRSMSFSSGSSSGSNGSGGITSKDDFPCKVCGKVFNKVKSRSAHMKSHRPQDSDSSTT